MAENYQEKIKAFLKPKSKKNIKAPLAGQFVKVHQIIPEKGKERIQIFEGLVIKVKRPRSYECSFTVRRENENQGVERIFPLYSPIIKKIEKVSKIHSKKNKLYYIRESKKRIRFSNENKTKNGIVKEEPKQGIEKEQNPKVKQGIKKDTTEK